MKVDNNSINIYRREIYNNIFRYAYENAEIGQLIQEVEPKWFGEVFNVSEIDTLLHRDITYYLKQQNLYRKIKGTCDKFIILPDVFSELLFPESYYEKNKVDENGIKDHGRSNVVIINNSVFELIDRTVKGIKFNYSGKFYYFFSSTAQNAERLISDTPSFKVLDTKEYTDFDYSSKYPIGEEIKGKFIFHLGISNNILTEAIPEDHLTMIVNYPCYVIDYDKDTIIPISTAPGLGTVNPRDAYIQEKIIDEREDKFIIHNRGICFTQTMIVIFKDGRYSIVNDGNAGFVNRVDKHTIEYYKDDTVSQIAVFYKPIYFDPSIERVDSLYDDVMKISEYGFYDLKYFQKNTDYLFRWIKYKNPSIEELVAYGYKYDLDVLHAIQQTFPTVINLTPDSLTVKTKGVRSNQLFLSVPNILDLVPVVFFDGVMFTYDTKMDYNGADQRHIHLNLSKFYKDKNAILKNSMNPEVDIREAFKGTKITVAYMSYVKTGEGTYTYPKEFKPVLDKDTPATLISRSELLANNHAIFFVNGRASNFTFLNSKLIYGMYAYDIGMGSDSKVITLMSKIKSPVTSFTKLNTVLPINKLEYDTTNRGVFNKSNYFSENAMLAFTEEGKLDTEILNVLNINNATMTNKMTISKQGDSAKILAVRLPRRNDLTGVDFEIDYSKVDKVFNIGSFNEVAIERNPSILTYFKLGNEFRIRHDISLYNETDVKNAGDLISTFGCVVTRPFNIDDYRKFITDNNIQIIGSNDLIPIESHISPEFKKVFKFYHIPHRVFTILAYSKDFTGKGKVGKLVTSSDIFNKEYPPQMQFYLDYGPRVDNNITINLLNEDKNFTYTPEFNNPPEVDITGPLVKQKLNLNYGYDKAHRVTTLEMQPQVLNLEKGDNENK